MLKIPQFSRRTKQGFLPKHTVDDSTMKKLEKYAEYKRLELERKTNTTTTITPKVERNLRGLMQKLTYKFQDFSKKGLIFELDINGSNIKAITSTDGVLTYPNKLSFQLYSKINVSITGEKNATWKIHLVSEPEKERKEKEGWKIIELPSRAIEQE
jgi:hypothetical protein